MAQTRAWTVSTAPDVRVELAVHRTNPPAAQPLAPTLEPTAGTLKRRHSTDSATRTFVARHGAPVAARHGGAVDAGSTSLAGSTSMNPEPPNGPRARELVILHFNDVYEIDAREREPVGGVARFISMLDTFASENPLVLFSGDFLAPSLLSIATRGMHMVPFFNRMKIGAAVIGNHDLDFGLEATTAAMAASNFPFLLSNVIDRKTGGQLAGAHRHLILEHGGVRIGLMGLIEEEWLSTLAQIEPAQVAYTDYVAVARELEPWLRREARCELVIALTHSREPNDHRLALECPGLDLILGGHDHDSHRKVIGCVPVIKSGTDFRELTRLAVALPALAPGPDEPRARASITWTPAYVTSAIAEDADAARAVVAHGAALAQSLEVVISELRAPLDFRFARIRTRETSGSNFVADAMRAAVPSAEIALLNSGTLRADDVVVPGTFRARDLHMLLPMLDELCVLGLTASQLVAALENGVRMWPRLEGRFLAVSGVRFEFDGAKPAGARVDVRTVSVNGEPLELAAAGEPERVYRVLTKNYLRCGKDGFGMLMDAPVLVDSEHVPLLPVLVQQHMTDAYARLNAAAAAAGDTARADIVRAHGLGARVDGRILNTAAAAHDED